MMKRLLLLLTIPLLVGAAPSRDNTYVSGQVIDPTKVTANEDAVFTYLQAGVDTYRDGSIAADDLASSSVSTAKIQTGAVTSTTILDGTILNADINASAAIGYSKLSTMSGDATITDGGALTIAANSVALTTDTTGNYVATLADAGNTTITVVNGSGEGLAATVDAVDVNCSNCIDGTDIALGSDAQGDIMYYNGTDWARLGAGTSGQFLKTQGAGANPTWANTTSFALFGNLASLVTNTVDYIGMTATNTTENRVSMISPIACTLQNLRAYVITRGAGLNAVVTVELNGADSALTTTVSSDATVFSDTANTVAVVAGDLVSFEYDSAGSGNTDTGIKLSVECK